MIEVRSPTLDAQAGLVADMFLPGCYREKVEHEGVHCLLPRIPLLYLHKTCHTGTCMLWLCTL